MIGFPTRQIAFTLIAIGMCMASAIAGDAADSFLDAYQSFKTGDRLESEHDREAALDHYLKSESLLLEILRDSPRWQPVVVQYRLRRTQEAISRLEIQTAKQKTDPGDDLEGPLPSADPEGLIPSASTAPPVVITQPSPAAKVTAQSRPLQPPPALHQGHGADGTPALSNALHELSALRSELASARNENSRLTRELSRSNQQLQNAISQVDIAKVGVVELKSQLAQAQAQGTIETLGALGPATLREEPARETARFLQKLAEQASETDMLREENDRLFAKLEQASSYIAAADSIRDNLLAERTTLAGQRDEARTQVVALKANLEEANTRLANAATSESGWLAEIASLTQSNQSLADRLADPGRSAKGAPAEALALLRTELEAVNKRLNDAAATISARETDISSLTARLDAANSELDRIKVSSPDDNHLLAENELLRGILLRQIKQQTQRDEAQRAIEVELANLKVESETLRQQLGILTSPVLELNAEERDLFKDPVALLPGPDAFSRMELELTIAKPSNGESTSAPGAPESTVSDGVLESIRAAQTHFDRRDFAAAEEVYNKLAAQRPDDYLILANLGAVQIEAGNLEAAEATLLKAIALSPDSPVARTHLGIAHSRQGRYENARIQLEKSIELDPTDAVAHNYLGVCFAQAGSRESCEMHLKKALAIDANYADAHFNLAVLYATTKPPSIDLAKQHYRLATELGASPDSSLERLIH